MALTGRRRFLVGAAAAGLMSGLTSGLVASCASSDPTGSGDPGAAGGTGPQRIRYRDHDEAVGNLWLPPGSAGAVPVAVLVHGGFWRQRFDLGLMTPLAPSLVQAGYAVWNIEYRRVGGGGGWPETFLDVAAAVDALAGPVQDAAGGRLDPDHSVTIGHSAGGHLAVWAASRHRLPEGAPGADPVVRPRAAIAQAGVLDLVSCARSTFGSAPCTALVGGDPHEVADRYAHASPAALLPVGVPVIAVHGSDDRVVPLRQSSDYVDAAVEAGDPAELVVVDGADHADMIDPDHQAWRVVVDQLHRLLPADG